MNFNDIEDTRKKYPNLVFNTRKQRFSGKIFIDNDDKYFVEIDITNFPHAFPKVWETNERIPPKPDRHVNSDGSLCFTTKANAEILLTTKVRTITDFIALILIPYLQNNSYYEINKKYKYGEFSHNIVLATVDTYLELLGIKDVWVLPNVLTLAIIRYQYKPNDKCYCGSGKKLKQCGQHQYQIKQLNNIQPQTLMFDLSIIDLWLKLIILKNLNSLSQMQYAII